jgi:hypothetical protein
VEVKEETPQNTSTPTPTVVGDQLSGEETKKEENNDNPVV